MQNRKLITCKLDTYFFLHSHCPSDPEPKTVRTGRKMSLAADFVAESQNGRNETSGQSKNDCPEVFICTRSRGRTGTTLLSLVFETNASTDSAIRAVSPAQADRSASDAYAMNREDKDRRFSQLFKK